MYDGDGKRVKKLSANDTTIFVYDAAGKLASEYLITTSNSQAPVTSYLTNDTLGSPRVTTDSSGNVVSRRDFRPYGEEIYRPNQGTDKVRQKFTSYERDNETDEDYAQARYYNYKLGRFNSVDPSRKSIILINPQNWNRFVYCLNNPYILADKNGKWPAGTHDAILARALDRMRDLEPKLMKSTQNGSAKTDMDGVNPKTLWEKNAPQHAMTPCSKVKELGIDEAKKWAKNEAIDFIEGKLGEAKKLYEKMKVTPDVGRYSLVQESLEKFGEAMHPIMDNVSPAHKDFQVFEYTRMTLIGNICDLLKHSDEEKREPTTEEMNVMVDEIRQRFRETYGDEAYEQAVSEEERKATAERLAKRGTEGMLKR